MKKGKQTTPVNILPKRFNIPSLRPKGPGHQKIIFLFLAIYLLFPLGLGASSLKFKLSLGRGRTAGTELNQFLHSWQESLKKQAKSIKTWSWQEGTLQELKQQVEFIASLEFRLSRHFSLSISSGYFYGALGEKQAQAIIDRPIGHSLFVQQVKLGSLPLSGEAFFYLPLTSNWEVYAGGGGGIIWLNFTQREGIKIEDSSSFNYPQEVNARGSGFQSQAVIGIVYHLQEISLFVEGNYRWSILDKLSGEDKTGEQGRLYYLEEKLPESGYWEAKYVISPTKPASANLREVRAASIDLSGFSLRIGLKINF